MLLWRKCELVKNQNKWWMHRSADTQSLSNKRQNNPSEKNMNAQFNRLINGRISKLGQLISKRNCIKPLMTGYVNLGKVQQLKSVMDPPLMDFNCITLYNRCFLKKRPMVSNPAHLSVNMKNKVSFFLKIC